MRAGNLPSLAAELVARDGEIAALRDLLVGHRLVEVVGPGGIGKTAVAIATGRTLVDVPVWLVRLEAAQTADDVLDTVVAAVGVVGGEAALQERLRRTETVLILDNCEHVVDAAAALVERLLDAAPTLRVLCTSQVPLELAQEAVFELAPLTLEDAARLFALRSARAGRPGAGARTVSVARRLAARDRARGGAHEDAVRRGDRAQTRRPLHRAERPGEPQARAPPSAEGDDRVELRPPVP